MFSTNTRRATALWVSYFWNFSSWITILKKRDNFRKSFDNFNYKKAALYGEDKTQELLLDGRIIRNKLKVRVAISNANAFIEIQKEYSSFDKYIWGF